MPAIASLKEILEDIYVEPGEDARRLARRYGYLEYMVERYIRILGSSAEDLLEAIEDQSILKPVARCNNLRIDCKRLEERLRNLGFEVRRLEWSREAIEILRTPGSPTPGSTHEYLKGYYYLHRDSSPLIPPLNMDLGVGDSVLDTCAAPGGKTTYIAQLTGDKGLVVANDISLDRIRSLVSNIARMGFKSIAVTRGDARRIKEVVGRKFNRILVDAPCSAEGYIMIDPGRKRRTDQKSLAALVRRQIEILASAIEILEPGGILVYSTCSIAPEENEYVVSRVLDIYDDEIFLREPSLSIWSRGIEDLWIKRISPEVRRCIRTWPHIHKTGGSFTCVIGRR
ncbi:MAG: RsmB/NOP family class I SAM-dependent RNA methyltransferase [Sulfolobales archaeon]